MKYLKISRRSSATAGVLVTCASLACAAAPDDGLVAYRGRTIDVRAYVEGFPYKNFYFAPEAGKAFFLRRGDSEVLHETQFKPGASVDFAKAKPIAQADFTKRNFWGIAVSSWNKRAYVRTDEDNTEVTNLYELEKSGALKKLTDEGYIYAWKISPDGRRIAFTARSGKQEFTPGSIGILDLASGKVRKVFEDSKALRMTWGELSWKPDGSAVLTSGACRASGPLFLTHGSNDKRVGVEESRAMLEALRKCGRMEDVYLELPGQGHGYKGTAAEVGYYRALFGFLDRIGPR